MTIYTPTEIFGVTLESGVRDQFKAVCAERGESMSAVLRRAIESYLEPTRSVELPAAEPPADPPPPARPPRRRQHSVAEVTASPVKEIRASMAEALTSTPLPIRRARPNERLPQAPKSAECRHAPAGAAICPRCRAARATGSPTEPLTQKRSLQTSKEEK